LRDTFLSPQRSGMKTESKCFDIVIATPGKDMVAQYTTSLINTVSYLNENKISYTYINDYSSHVGDARQKTFDTFYKKYGLNSTYKKIIWIDSDISWKNSDFISLYESKLDIVSGCYQIFPGHVAAHKTPNHIYSTQELNSIKNKYEQVCYCGMGFMAINHGIIENIKNPFFQTDIFYENKLYSSFNEDVAFCTKAKTILQKQTWIDTSIRVNHHKIQTLGWG
jgi:hypothetical protein